MDKTNNTNQSRNDLDIDHFKQKLTEEKTALEEQLSTVGRINPDNPQDWEATQPDMNVMQADKNEVADTIEAFEENTAILKELEIRLENIKKALKRIEEGTYGICEVSGEPIEEKRLEANPAARTCIAHRETELENE